MDKKKINANTKHIAVFLKQPILGFVKTRIAKTENEKFALKVYNILLEKTAQLLKDVNNRILNLKIHLYYTPHISYNDMFSNINAYKKKQCAGNLGERLNHAMNEIKPKIENPLLFLGSDCYDLDCNTLVDAFEKLKNHDICIGPAKDGGYYLIGMSKPSPFLFSNMKWSSDTLLLDTKNKINANKKTVHYLKLLSDIDTMDDILTTPKLHLLL